MQNIRKMPRDKELFRMIVTIAIPVALQNLLVFLTQILDTIMLGELGDVPLTASSLGTQIFNVYSLFIFGLAGGSAVLTAQYWGKKELQPIKIIIATVTRLVTVVGLILSVIVLVFPAQVMMIFSNDPEVIAAGEEYLRYVGYMYFFFGVSNSLTMLLRSVEKVRIAVVANAVSLVTNGFFNYMLIFGKFGAPRLEIKGAAIATTIAKVVEFLIVVIYVFFIEDRLKFRPKDLMLKSKVLSMDLRKYCTPVAVNEVVWSMGIAMQSVLFGRVSTLAVSANAIIGVIQQMATIVIFGVANATAVIIGKTIGEGDLDLAERRGKTMKYFAVIMGICSAAVILLCRDVMVDFYNVSAETKVLAKEMLLITAIVVFFVSNCGVSIVGILRGSGDTRFCMLIEIITLWGVAVPLGFVAGLALKLPVLVIYAVFKSDEMLKTFICWYRIRGSRWVRSVTRDEI